MKLLNKAVVFILLSVLFFSCKKEYPQADVLLTRAEALYASGNFKAAKLTIDSIAKVAPKAFPQINAGLSLLDSVRYGENIQIVTQSDTLLKQVEARLEQQKGLFTYQLNPAYQDNGNYFPKSYPESLSGIGLYAGVEANGSLFLESVSNRSLQHSKLIVSTSDGASAETGIVTDDGGNYHFQSGGKSVEVVHFSGKRENGVAAFIVANHDKIQTVTLSGKASASFSLSNKAKKGISDSYTLSHLFTQRDSLRFLIEKSKQLIKYLDSRKEKEMTEKAKEHLK